MEAPVLRQAVHVDPNNDPWLYQNLDLFALLFDKISVWSFSPNLFDRLNPRLKVEHFRTLVLAPESPYLLAGRDTWFRPGTPQRSRILQEWNETFDAPVAHTLVPKGRVFQYQHSPAAVDLAWKAATALYHEASEEFGGDLRESHLVSGAAIGDEARVVNAYRAANEALAFDRAVWNGLPGSPNEKAEAAFQKSFRLPVIFQQTTDPSYRRNLEDLGPLPCLYYEHFTKPQMIAAIEAHWRAHHILEPFSMFIFGDWHRLLANGVGPRSSLESLRQDYPQLSLFLRRESRPQMYEDVAILMTNLLKTTPSRDEEGAAYTQALLNWNRGHGPSILRELARDVWRQARDHQPQTWATNVSTHLRDAAAKIVAEERLLNALDGFVPYLGAALGFAVSLYFEFGEPSKLATSPAERTLKVLLEMGTTAITGPALTRLTAKLLHEFREVCLKHNLDNPYFLWRQLDDFGTGAFKRENA